MIQDLHSHTYYSFCGVDKPEDIVEAAINGGIELLGITDHNYGIGHGRYRVCYSKCDEMFNDYERTLIRYFDHINLVKEKYADSIKILTGIEISSDLARPRTPLPDNTDISFFDYCLIEGLDKPAESSLKGDLFGFSERCRCPLGIAHTDMFSFIKSIGEEPYKYFKKMADNKIFWEMNVSYDSTHNFHEHEYVKEFFNNREQQQIIKESGVCLSVGFDAHMVEGYRADRVIDACKKISALDIPLAFEK